MEIRDLKSTKYDLKPESNWKTKTNKTWPIVSVKLYKYEPHTPHIARLSPKTINPNCILLEEITNQLKATKNFKISKNPDYFNQPKQPTANKSHRDNH